MTDTPDGRQKSTIGIGLLGLGVVGGGVAKILSEKSHLLAELAGCPLSLKAVLVRDPSKPRGHELPPSIPVTTNVADILDNPQVDIIVEVMGGEQPALDYISQSISVGKNIVTANKEVIARYGPDLLTQARENGVQILFEASVAAGTPIIAPLLRDLVVNDILNIRGIINGTTNYILTRMAREGVEFGVAVNEAQKLGYAEADPSDDVEGTDAAYKLAILASLAFRTRIKDSDVYREGITRITARDFHYAAEFGYAVKLLAIANKQDGAVQLRVHPAFVPIGSMLAGVDGVQNTVEIETDLVGKVLFNGRGAGSMATASAVVANIMDIARDVAGKWHNYESGPIHPRHIIHPSPLQLSEELCIRQMDELQTKYYLRLEVADQPGVFAQITTVLANFGISLASVMQKETHQSSGTAELVLMTHSTRESSMEQATQKIGSLDVLKGAISLVRVED